MLKDFTISPAKLEALPRERIKSLIQIGCIGLDAWRMSRADRQILKGKIAELQAELVRRDTWAERNLLPSIRGEKKRRKS